MGRVAAQVAAPASAKPVAPAAIQRKARIGQVDDPLEREADRIADAVVAGRPIGTISSAPVGSVHTKCAECGAEQEPLIQRKCAHCRTETSGGGDSAETAARVVSQGGAPLAPQLRAYFEPRFGADFSGVRVHTHAEASRAATTIGARAYTSGSNIAFAPGEYAPGSRAGQRLIAHELSHVLQQGRGALAQPIIQRETLAEYEARIKKEEEEKAKAAAAKDAEERAQIERASARGRRFANDENNKIRSNFGGIEVVYRMLTKYFHFFQDSVAGVGFNKDADWIRILPSNSGAKLGEDTGLMIEIGPKFIRATTDIQKVKLEAALRTIPSIAGSLDYARAVAEGAAIASGVDFGSMTGRVQGQADPNDAYDASAWDEVGSKVIRAKIEPWRAIKRLVDRATSSVPKKGGGTTRWRFDCFDAVVFAQVYAQWRVMTRYDFNSFYSPLELGFASKPSLKTEWEEAVRSKGPGGSRFIEHGDPIMGPQSAGPMNMAAPPTPVKESWTELLANAPVGTQIIWTNSDAVKRCKAAENQRKIDPRAAEPSFCESWQNENATKIGADNYLAHGIGNNKKQSEIEESLAKAVIDTLAVKPNLSNYIKTNIYISALRRPKRRP